MTEGRWRAPWMCRRCDHNNDQRHGRQRQGGQHLGRSALHVGTTVVCPLPLALQAVGTKIFALHGEQMDVYLGHTDNMALHPWPCLKHRFCFRAHEHMVGNGLCGILRHLHQLHLHDGWPADPSPDSCQRLQLHAAAGVGKRQRGCWPCGVQDLTSLGRHSRVLWRLVRGKIEIET